MIYCVVPKELEAELYDKLVEYYKDNLQEIRSRTDVSAHKQPAKMGIIKLLKWIS